MCEKYVRAQPGRVEEGTELSSTSSLAAGTAQEVGCLFALVHILNSSALAALQRKGALCIHQF